MPYFQEHDGFDVCELDGLDRSSSDDENWPTELADVNEEDDNPFMVSTLKKLFFCVTDAPLKYAKFTRCARSYDTKHETKTESVCSWNIFQPGALTRRGQD